MQSDILVPEPVSSPSSPKNALDTFVVRKLPTRSSPEERALADTMLENHLQQLRQALDVPARDPLQAADASGAVGATGQMRIPRRY